MHDIDEKISLCVSSVIGTISLVDFKTILDIVLLVISIINIIIVICIKVWRYLGNDKQLDDSEKADIMQDMNALKSNINTLENKMKGEENGRRKEE